MFIQNACGELSCNFSLNASSNSRVCFHLSFFLGSYRISIAIISFFRRLVYRSYGKDGVKREKVCRCDASGTRYGCKLIPLGNIEMEKETPEFATL